MPSHAFFRPANQSMVRASLATLPMRLVKISQVRCGVCSIRSNRSMRHASGTSLSNTSARLLQNTGQKPFRPAKVVCGAAAFQRSGSFQFAGLVRRRAWPAPHWMPMVRAGVLTLA